MSDSRLLRNVFSNYVRFALTGLIGFVVTPILFHSLLAENYAILVFTLGTVSILEGLELGFFSTLLRFISDLEARGQHAELRSLASSVFFLLLGTGILGTLILLGTSPFLARFFRITGTAAAPGHWALALVGLSLAFQLPATAVRGFLDGCQDFFRANVVDVTTQVLRAALTVLLLWAGFGLLAIAAVFPVAAWFRLLGMLLMARQASIPFRPRLSEFRWKSLEKTSGFASLSFIAENANWCFLQLDTFLVPRLLPLSSLAILAISRRFPGALTELCYQTFVVTFPAVSAAAAREDRQAMHRFLFVSTRNLLAFSLPLAASLFLWAEPVLRLWIGTEVLGGVPVFQVFLVFAVFSSLRWIPLTFLYAAGNVRFLAIISVATLVGGLGGGAWACSRSGLVGLAVAFTAIQTVGTLLLFRQALHIAEVQLHLWIRKAVLPALWALLPAAVWFWISHRSLPQNLFGLVVSVIPGLLLFAGLFVRLVAGPGKQSWRVCARKLLTEID
ncbi:MAG: oligosaccharide flippase family protein [Acidobacteria bacterium]|nr:oligosaccharide flippase family protein [Acidobacteriota bacterium]